MGGGLMQLVAYGAQDIYLTGNPQITFFKVVYRRHTNFAMEAIQQTWNGSGAWGGTQTATISRNGDLVGNMIVEIVEAGNSAGVGAPNAGSAYIKEVVCEIGGQQIDKHYSHWLEVYAELTEENTQGNMAADLALRGTTSAKATTAQWTKFQRMACMGGVTGFASGITRERMFVPLRFWFNRNPGLALPLIALQYHEVKIKLTWCDKLQVDGNSTFPSTAALWCDYIYLDTDERRRFAQVSHEYLIEQVQFQSNDAATSTLNFNHPVKELIWTGGVTSTSTVSAGPSTPLSLLAGNSFQLKLNGHDRFAARDRMYFTREQVWKYHTGYGSVGTLATGDVKDAIAVYSFALKPEEHQPSGTCNFSRIDNAQIVQGVGAAQALYIYAVNYNVLRIMSGMGGLAYSN